MALDPIWKQQLTLVTYGNTYLTAGQGLQRWLEHPIFDQHLFQFRDLQSQHLLAQHFQIWLEGLKKQGVKRLSLHSSHLLIHEQNPNPNVELLPYAHFIVSHSSDQNYAWIAGQELAEWYLLDQDYAVPQAQRIELRNETLWRYPLDKKLNKLIQADLQQPNWQDIQHYIDSEIFQNDFAIGFTSPITTSLPYTGLASTEDPLLALIPTDIQADFAHSSLHRFDQFEVWLQDKIQHPYDENQVILSPEKQSELRQFAAKVEELKTKLIVKIANHHQTAQVVPRSETKSSITTNTILDSTAMPLKPKEKSTSFGAVKLIVSVIVLCLIAYYLGL